MERSKLKDDDQIYPPPGYVMFRSIIFSFYVPDITGVFLPGGFPGLETLCPVLYQSLVYSLRCLHSSGSQRHHQLEECGQCSSYLHTVEAIITSITHTHTTTEVCRFPYRSELRKAICSLNQISLGGVNHPYGLFMVLVLDVKETETL